MELGEVDLGILSLRSKASPLTLELSSRCYFAPPLQGDFDSLYELTSKILIVDIDSRPWIFKANAFQLTLNITLPSPYNTDQETFIDEIVSRLPHSKIWEQLSLSITSVKTGSNEPNKSVQIAISLVHDSASQSKPKRMPHKLSIGVPFDAVKPPSGTDTLTIARVKLEMKITCDEKSVEIPICIAPPSSPIFPAIDDEPEQLPIQEEFHYTDTREEAFSTVRNGSRSESRATSLGSESTMLDAAGNDIFSDELFPLDPNQNDHSLLACDADNNEISPEFIPQLTPPDAYQLEDIVELLDAGIRHAICNPPRRSLPGVKFTSDQPFHRLAHTVPTLWSPEFLSKVSSKSVFMPTLSHAIASIGRRARVSRTLGSKVAEISRRSNLRQGLSTELKDSQAAISESLWRVLQRGTFSDGPVALQPVFPITDNSNCAMGRIDDIEPVEPSANGCDPGFEYGDYPESDEDLFGFLEEEKDNHEIDKGSLDDEQEMRLCELLDGPCVARYGESHPMANNGGVDHRMELDYDDEDDVLI